MDILRAAEDINNGILKEITGWCKEAIESNNDFLSPLYKKNAQLYLCDSSGAPLANWSGKKELFEKALSTAQKATGKNKMQLVSMCGNKDGHCKINLDSAKDFISELGDPDQTY